MGGPTGTRKLLRTKYPSAFTEYAKETERAKKYADAILMIDVLVALRTIAYNDQKMNNKLTGYQWAKALMQKVRYAFSQHFAGVVLCMDNEALVPPYKAAEQKKRAKARETTEAKAFKDATEAGKPLDADHFKPFKRGCKLEMGGVVTEEGKEAQPLTMQRLLATRELRAQLLDVVVECLQDEGLARLSGCTNEEDAKRCAGRFLIIDHSSKIRKDGGVAMNKSDDWKEYVSAPWICTAEGGLRRLEEDQFLHPFGEADLGMMFWSHVFRDYDCVHDSNDTDQDDVTLNYLEFAKSQLVDKRRGKLLLRYTDTYSGKVWVQDARELYAAMQEDNFSASCYSLYSALGGNDYSAKDQMTHGLGEAKIFETACKSQILVEISKVLRNNCVLGEHMHFVWLRLFHPEVRILKQAKEMSRVTTLIDKFVAAVPGKLRVMTSSSSGSRLEAYDMVVWSWQYWHDAIRMIYNRTAKIDVPLLLKALVAPASEKGSKRKTPPEGGDDNAEEPPAKRHKPEPTADATTTTTDVLALQADIVVGGEDD